MSDEKCPDCGSGFASPHHKRYGWHYAQCGRRRHEEHGWETMPPASCLQRQVDRLQAIVDKLPKTADGVVITPGRTFYEAWRTAPGEIRSLEVADWYDHEDDSPLAAAEMYSTREAAEGQAAEAQAAQAAQDAEAAEAAKVSEEGTDAEKETRNGPEK